ncbi:MAG TPA: copper chaperone PCu(A)C [Steroidobacteraceae bacterium]|jgi:hypothetical protein|nr:copper chaperone PCu(A)C [Steroidobacteraceae bacterium]
MGVRTALLALIAASTAWGAANLEVRDAWSRPTPPAVAVGAVYLSIVNHGAGADRLLGAATPRAGRVEIHESRSVQGIMQMRPVAFVDIPAGATVRVAPEGLHLMLVGLDAPLLAGTQFPITLKFRDAGAVTVPVKVASPP